MNGQHAGEPPRPVIHSVDEHDNVEVVPWTHVSFWLTASLLCLLLNYVVATISTGFGKRPLDVNGKLLCLAAGIAVTSWILMLAYLLRRPRLATRTSRLLVGVGAAIIIFVPIGLVVAALRPAALPPDQDYIFVPPPKPVEHRFGTTFLYPHASDKLSDAEISRLADDIEMLRRCDLSNIEIRAYASSAKYRTANESRNLELANRRADVVSKMLKSKGIQVAAHHWQTFFEMSNDKRIRDVDASGKRILKKERLNRRAEVWWTEGQPCPELSAK